MFGCACHSRRALFRAGLAAAAVGSPLARPRVARAQAGVRAIDIHAHYFPETSLERAAREGGGEYVLLRYGL